MKGIRYLVLFILPLSLAPFNRAQAQTSNAPALSWLRLGLAEKDLAKKISAYEKAIALDSSLVEAKYNLGLAYKKQQNYARAEKWFAQAYATKPERLSAELKQQILFELGKTQKKQGKLRESEETLKSAKAVAVDRAARAGILFELGRCLYEQNRYEEALVELRDGRRLNDNAENFQNFINLVEKAQESKRLQLAAEEAVRQGNAQQARTFVEELQRQELDLQKSELLAAKVDSLVKFETNQRILTALDEQAQKETAAGDLLAAAQIYEKILLRHPERVRLYPILANLYLLLRRQDEAAMKIYKAILNLNIATQKHEEINALVAQNYLAEGRTDSDAIAVLESALKIERRKQHYPNAMSNA